MDKNIEYRQHQENQRGPQHRKRRPTRKQVRQRVALIACQQQYSPAKQDDAERQKNGMIVFRKNSGSSNPLTGLVNGRAGGAAGRQHRRIERSLGIARFGRSAGLKHAGDLVGGGERLILRPRRICGAAGRRPARHQAYSAEAAAPALPTVWCQGRRIRRVRAKRFVVHHRNQRRFQRNQRRRHRPRIRNRRPLRMLEKLGELRELGKRRHDPSSRTMKHRIHLGFHSTLSQRCRQIERTYHYALRGVL